MFLYELSDISGSDLYLFPSTSTTVTGLKLLPIELETMQNLVYYILLKKAEDSAKGKHIYL